MAEAGTIFELLAIGADDAVAVGAPGRTILTFADLREQVAEVVTSLNGFGIGREDRVAMVIPNSPETAVAFLGVAACATAAPLNPAYQPDEFEFYLNDLRAGGVIVPAGDASAVTDVARRLNIPVIELQREETGPAGRFHLSADLSGMPARGGYAEADDVALVLHTSGTTSRPKIVPLRQRNLCASARNIRETLQLTPADRCLNVMPLFHIHGLIAAVLSGVGAGGSVFCCPAFSGRAFFDWMAEARPTWYTAVPSMHQIILTRAGEQAAVIGDNPLRFIRSSSSSLAPSVMAELESVFGAPVIEAYGMTEATHQMASNPLPPEARKPGTVGQAAGPEVAIMDEAGALVAQGAVGEIVIHGANVTSAYENNPEANATAFSDGWFRTGDQGQFDADGYLTITGRLKEIINRGGEKISPREVDEVLLTHPAVAQVVTFAAPHDLLGEEVACAIVLRDGWEATADEIQTFAAEKLIKFKVPSQVVFLDEIPKGATGKLQRIGLAEKLGLT